MLIAQRPRVLSGPYFFRFCLHGSDPQSKSRRVELFAGNILPSTVVYLRILGEERRGSAEGDFYGLVSKTMDVLNCGSRSRVFCPAAQKVVGHVSTARNRSWIAPAPWNYSPQIL